MNINESFENYRNKPCEKRLSEVLQNSQSLIYGIIVKVAKHSQDAEDLTQEVLIKVIQNINLLPHNVNFGGWLNRVSLNSAIDHYHQRHCVKTLSRNMEESTDNHSSENKDETIAIIYQHLAKLESVEETLILNKFIHALTYDQMSILYKQPRSTIELKINNILKKLKTSIEKAGFAGVALALTSTLEEIKALECTLNLLPKIKDQFPATYPKSTSKVLTSKVLLKVAVPIVTVLLAYFTLDSLFVSRNKDQVSTNKISRKENILQSPLGENNGKKIVANNQIIKDEKSDNQDAIAINENIPAGITTIIINKEDQKSAETAEFAGQLIDAESKKPIENAKLEIWDIYTYEKFETTTDADGKYFKPKDLDTTFFLLLKFIKEGYAVKQTFQHFEIHSKILIEMKKGKKIIYKLDFDKLASGDLYLGSYCNLAYDQHLSSNQKNILNKVFSCLINTAPFDCYTFKKINFENKKEYTVNELFEVSEDEKRNFVIWSSSYKERNFISFYESRSGNLGLSYKTPLKIRMASTGKIVANTDLNIFIYGTNEKFNFMSDHMGIIPVESMEILRSGVFTIGNNEFFAENWTYQTGEHFNDYELGKYWYLFPCTSISFEPLSLNSEFHNTQVIFGDIVYSKKTLNRKSNKNSGNLNVYDKFFEKTILIEEIKIPIGGEIDINSKLNLNNEKETKIQIILNNKPLRERDIRISKMDDNGYEFSSPLEVRINENGFCFFKIPSKSKALIIDFTINKINYSKLIDTAQILNDNLTLKFNRKIEIKLSQAVKDLNEKSNNNIKNIYHQSGTFMATKEFYDARIYKRIINENTSISSISFSNSESSLFVEEGAEYELIENEVSGIKTKYNQLKAVKCSVKRNINSVEVLPIAENDYIPIQFEISDEMGNEIKEVNWCVKEITNFFTLDSDRLNRLDLLKENYPGWSGNPFYRATVDDLSEYGSLTPEYVEDMTIGEEAIKNKTVSLLTNRKYYILVFADGFVDYIQLFSTKEFSKINKKIILRKANSVKFKPNFKKETNEIVKLLKANDIIFEYDEVRIFNKTIFENTQYVCNKEVVTIKLLRNDQVISLLIPSFQIHGIEDCFYEDNKGLLIR